LKNETKADLIFNVGVEGPFEVVATKTNSGARHPLASRPTSTSKPESMFNL